MRSEFNPVANDFRSPFFVGSLSFLYQVSYRKGNKTAVITYASPHEIILNLHVFSKDDEVNYINKENGHKAFTLTIDRFKIMISESIYSINQSTLELLYLRLILTNWHSKAVVDKGRLRYYDNILRKYLLTLRGGYDSYLTYEDKRVVMRFKCRRESALHLRAVVSDWNLKGDVQVNHINLPKTLPNQNLIYECLKTEVDKNFLRMYSYSPIPEDNIITTKIDCEIIQIINQLIK